MSEDLKILILGIASLCVILGPLYFTMWDTDKVNERINKAREEMNKSKAQAN